MNPQYETYYAMLGEANKRFNLTAIEGRDAVFLKHFEDSRTGAGLIPNGASVIDVGSGAGFPGMVLAIERPDAKVVLLESSRKKAQFLTEVKDALGLSNVRVCSERAEVCAGAGLSVCGHGCRGAFSVAVARAVARLSLLLEYTLPFLELGGRLIAYKAKDAESEILEAQNALFALGGRVVEKKAYSIGDERRVLVVIEKVRETPAKYPRQKAGKRPL